MRIEDWGTEMMVVDCGSREGCRVSGATTRLVFGDAGEARHLFSLRLCWFRAGCKGAKVAVTAVSMVDVVPVHIRTSRIGAELCEFVVWFPHWAPLLLQTVPAC